MTFDLGKRRGGKTAVEGEELRGSLRVGGGGGAGHKREVRSVPNSQNINIFNAPCEWRGKWIAKITGKLHNDQDRGGDCGEDKRRADKIQAQLGLLRGCSAADHEGKDKDLERNFWDNFPKSRSPRETSQAISVEKTQELRST